MTYFVPEELLPPPKTSWKAVLAKLPHEEQDRILGDLREEEQNHPYGRNDDPQGDKPPGQIFEMPSHVFKSSLMNFDAYFTRWHPA